MRHHGWLGAFLLALAAMSATAQTRPATYSEFHTSIAPGDGEALEAAITGGAIKYIYLQSGTYVLDNPVTIDRTTSLYIHGIDRMNTRLVAFDPRQPLFVVQRAPLLNLAGVHLEPNRNAAYTLHAKAMTMVNPLPVTVEIMDSVIDQSVLEFNGPGSFRVQASAFTPTGKVRHAVVVDHPGADVLIFGGTVTNGREPLKVDSYAHFWQKRGRLRLYSASLVGALGPADVLIERASTLGPHVLANLRSEGANGALNQSGAVSRLLQVPPTSERVDVVLKNNGGAWLTGPIANPLNCKLAAYNGAGTLWLLGNRAEKPCGRHLVEGNAPQATIVSVGNMINSPQPFPVIAKTIITSADSYNHNGYTGSVEKPWTRWIPDGRATPRLAAYANVPQPPQDLLPAALSRPSLTAALPGMLDVKAAPFRAKGDGTTDDTAAIQTALDAHCGTIPKALYFPAGTYRISNTLYLHHHAGGTCRKSTFGGWIAGAGSGRTILAMAPGVKKGVLATDGFAFATVQGITFKTWPWRAGDPQRPNVDLEMYPGFIATQQNNFYDVVFDGGAIGFANGVSLPTPGQCSSSVVFGGTFRNSRFGLVSGHYNALLNGAYDSQFIDNDHAIGAWTTDEVNLPPGGAFFAYRSSSRGSRDIDFVFRATASGSTWYFYEWDSDAASYFRTGAAAAPHPVMFERARLSPRSPATYQFDVGTSQGMFFLYSTLTRGGIRIGQSAAAQSYAIKMQSVIPDWAASVAPDPNGQLEEISWTSSGAQAPPAAPVLLD